MKNRESMIKLSAVLLALGLALQPIQAYADRGRGGPGPRQDNDDHRRGRPSAHHFYSPRPYPRHGSISFFLPGNFLSITLGGSRFFYSEGVYYRRSLGSYVVVPPPQGAILGILPPGYQPVVINGVTYYAADGVYYKYTPQGYVVVQNPVILPGSLNVVQGGSYTVNIPNNRGGYTAVVIRNTGNGFTGPQGEYYAQFPTVDQLRTMYGG